MKRAIGNAGWALLLALAALPANAIYPESGWYWNANESGRGFNLEIQDNILFMSAFVYRADGTPVWYVAGGPMANDRTFSADLYETSNGQCLGCAYRPATPVKVGTASITFSNERTAAITLPNATVNVVRQDWSGYGSNSRDALMGEWSSTEGDPAFPVYFGDRISFSLALSDAAGPYAGGWRTGSTSNLAVGSWSATTGSFNILIDSSATFYRFYSFQLVTLNRAEGVYWTYAKTALPTGLGTYFVSHRTKSGAFVRSGVGPGVTKSAATSALRDTIDASMAAQAPAAGEAPAPILEAAQRLESILRKR